MRAGLFGFLIAEMTTKYSRKLQLSLGYINFNDGKDRNELLSSSRCGFFINTLLIPEWIEEQRIINLKIRVIPNNLFRAFI